MNDERLAELKEKYKDRNLFEELAWGAYADHSGYTSKQNGEFLNWLCMRAYKALKERPQGKWEFFSIGNCQYSRCSVCKDEHTSEYTDLDWWYENFKYCPKCGAYMMKEEENGH